MGNFYIKISCKNPVIWYNTNSNVLHTLTYFYLQVGDFKVRSVVNHERIEVYSGIKAFDLQIQFQ